MIIVKMAYNDSQQEDEYFGPFVNLSDVVAHVDDLGYLWCAECKDASGTPVLRDSFPHNKEKCELCHRIVKDVG